MVNALTRKTGLTLGPIILETLVKHYFERVVRDHERDGEDTTKLRKEELLYDEAFNIIKSFMEAATKHTVEELQAFSNTRTPSPPWVHVVRLLVPMSCCDEAATYVIKALGGEEVTKRVVGGTKWWQVRGVSGVDAEWIVAKKDWQEAKRKHKARGNDAPINTRSSNQEIPPDYQPEMDQMRCILYAHGGGYYFGSIDQERYSIQRLARKINGRVFTMNYRLAPQYPFPCAIQDFIASYLYLIRPPPGSLHTPVSPSNIVFAGDSAGGGLCIAGLQVVRDSGLPLPAGAVLISPWCDLTHSFPSIHINTATDIIPQYGLSFHKPSTLWPPPSDDLTSRIHQGLRARIREAVSPKSKDGMLDIPASETDTHPNGLPSRATTPDYSIPMSSTGQTLHLGGAGPIPVSVSSDGIRSQRVSMVTPSGEEIAIDNQVHMYAPNCLLTHPLVSPVVSYLGGLPPLLVIASDKEVLRDEILYFAHKAARPDQYQVKPEAKLLYPALDGIEERYAPTQVHLQVYDDCAHTLPVLFAFTTPGKYCFRAMATFIKYVTGMLPELSVVNTPVVPEAPVTASPAATESNLLSPFDAMGEGNKPDYAAPSSQADHSAPAPRQTTSAIIGSTASVSTNTPHLKSTRSMHEGRSSMRRTLSSSVTHASSFLRRHHSVAAGLPSSSSALEQGRDRQSSGSSDVGGPRFQSHQHRRSTLDSKPTHQHTGESFVYEHGLDTMIRERISTHGVIRPLEPESELDAFRLPPELIGEMSELAVRRYIDGVARFGKKFGKTAKGIEKARRKNLERARQETARNMAQLHTPDGRAGAGAGTGKAGRSGRTDGGGRTKDGLPASGSWLWAWALDADENPPPSSIVSRRDTEEARRLARIADQAVFMDTNTMSGNNLWSLIVNFLTATPERDGHHHHHHNHHKDQVHGSEHSRQGSEVGKVGQESRSGNSANAISQEKEKESHPAEKPGTTSRREKMRSRFAWLVTENRKSQGVGMAAKAQNEQ